MIGKRTRWRLARVVVTDMLAFQGSQEFCFETGIQVIEAPNHTCKTSLAMATLWGVTGNVPALGRLDKTSFLLTNRHAGENADPAVVVEMVSTDGDRKLSIHRRYAGRKKKIDLEAYLDVEIDDSSFSGTEARDRILEELDVSPGSFEGCGVVLQDHRLKLISGKDREIGDVINDMLGLYNLSRLVPVLEDASKQAKALRARVSDHVAAADPLRRWQDREKQLMSELQEAEDRSVEAGFSREDLEDPGATALRVLGEVAESLEIEIEVEGDSPARIVELIRVGLASLRKSSPEAAKLRDVQAMLVQAQSNRGGLERLIDELARHDDDLTTESSAGEMDTAVLARIVAENETRIAENEKVIAEIAREQEFLGAAYKHLLACGDLDGCPLCGAEALKVELTTRTKARIESDIARQLEQLQAGIDEARRAIDVANQRSRKLERIRSTHSDLVARIDRFMANLAGQAEGEDRFLVEEPSLFTDREKRTSLASHIREALDGMKGVVEELENARTRLLEQRNRLEELTLHPAESRVNTIVENLLPLGEAHARVQQHGTRRDIALEAQSELTMLEKQAREFSGRLKKIAKALAQNEQDRATEAVRKRLPDISEVFRTTAANMDFDGLDVLTAVKRDRVSYQLRATSSRIGNLGDAVGHVLSEGDLSAASMALLIGLSSGEEHGLGFILLDDPAQGMDETLQRNLASVMGKLGQDRQIIVLTHQHGFASALEDAGATRRRIEGWRGGKIVDE